MSGKLPGELVAVIMAAVAAREGRAPRDLRLVSAVPASAQGAAGPAPSAWALAGRLQQMRGLSR